MARCSLLLALLLLTPACARNGAEVIVLAAASMEPYLAPVLEPLPRVRAAYGASGALARQLEQGVPAEVVILADRADGERLVERGVLEAGSLQPFIANQLVLISARPGARTAQMSLDDLPAAPFERIAVGDPQLAPVGRYAYEALAARGILESLRPRLVPVPNARVVWSTVTSHSCDAGFLYATDVIEPDQARIICTVDPALHRPIVYVIGLKKNASAAGREVYEELRSDAVRQRLVAAGFCAPQAR